MWHLEMIKSSKICIHLIKDPPNTWRKTGIPKRKINSSTLQLEILMSFQHLIEPVGKKKKKNSRIHKIEQHYQPNLIL